MAIGPGYRKNWIRVVLAALLVAVTGAVIGLDIWTGARRPGPSAWAEERADNAQSVLPLCVAFPKVSPEQIGLCAGYLKAIAHVLVRNTVDGRRACIPRETTLGALRDAVVALATRDPDLKHRINTDAFVARALSAGFPCPR